MVLPGKAVASGWVSQEQRPMRALVLEMYQCVCVCRGVGEAGRIKHWEGLSWTEGMFEPCFSLSTWETLVHKLCAENLTKEHISGLTLIS